MATALLQDWSGKKAPNFKYSEKKLWAQSSICADSQDRRCCTGKRGTGTLRAVDAVNLNAEAEQPRNGAHSHLHRAAE